MSLVVAVLLGALVGCGERSRPNVLVFNVDMLRADHVGVYGYDRDTTPELDRLARAGVWFRRAHAQSSWTYPSVVSLLTGRYPTSHGAGYSRDGDRYITTALSESIETLPAFLQRNGWATGGFVTNPLLKRTSGLARGFDVYQDDFVGEWRRDRTAPWWLDSMAAEHVNRRLLEWIDRTPSRPLFAYVHYIDVHGPYRPPRPFGRDGGVSPEQAEAARLQGRPRDVAVDVYDGALRHLDGLLAELFRELDRRGVLDESIVVVTSDHGEEFDDHGGHGHGHTVYQELLHVPLVFARTGAFDRQRTIDAPVAQVDLFPTIADLVGLAPPTGLAGESLRPLLDGAAAGAARAILSEMDNRGRPVWNVAPGALPVSYALLAPPGTKYVVSMREPLRPGAAGGHAQEAIYDLLRDPGERTNLAASSPERDRLRALLETEVARAASAAATPATVPIDAETRDRLRQLGYTD